MKERTTTQTVCGKEQTFTTTNWHKSNDPQGIAHVFRYDDVKGKITPICGKDYKQGRFACEMGSPPTKWLCKYMNLCQECRKIRWNEVYGTESQ